MKNKTNVLLVISLIAVWAGYPLVATVGMDLVALAIRLQQEHIGRLKRRIGTQSKTMLKMSKGVIRESSKREPRAIHKPSFNKSVTTARHPVWIQYYAGLLSQRNTKWWLN